MKLISRKEAIQQGLKYYFTGKPCKQGHISKRHIDTFRCYECSIISNRKYNKQYNIDKKETISLYGKSYYENNKEQISIKGKLYRIKNRTIILERERQKRKIDNSKNLESSKRYVTKNRDKVIAYKKLWRQNNPHLTAKYWKIRNTRLEDAIPIWYEEDLVKQIYLKRDELNELWGTRFEVDHIIPLNPKNRSVSGLHCWHNLQLLDISLNRSKTDIYNTDW